MNQGLVYLTIGIIAFFGAGTADMLTDTVPIRPYSGIFITGLALRKRHTQHKDYNANRSHTQVLEQINEPLETYVAKRKAEFKRKYGK